nr:MAG TPA: Potassium voltage-gated channel subfamily E, membrane protein, potassium channel [Caudoviricetes sp.]
MDITLLIIMILGGFITGRVLRTNIISWRRI